MAFRHVYIEHPVYISIKLKQLNIYSEHDQYTFTIPLEDIESIILDNYKSVITAYALMEITRYKITMVICGSNHLPQGICLPQHQYYKKFTMLNEQFKMSKQVIGRLWRNIVKQKLKNESTTLSILNRPYTSNIEKLIKLVKPNDVNNVEAQAARIYFIALFGQDFQRRDENPLNDVLNYGYAIIRSMISRDLCAYGLEPCLGLHHHNYLNSFNLSDDLIEPFRSYVDLYVFYNMQTFNKGLSSSNKKLLVNMINGYVYIDNQYETVTNAIHGMVSAYNNCCINKSSRIVLPEIRDEK